MQKQKTDNERFLKWKKDVDALVLRFPIATIAKMTNTDKGYVSKALKGTTTLSDNFLSTFYDKVDEMRKGTTIEAGAEKGSLSMDAIVNLTKANILMAEAHKDFAEANRTLAKNNEALISMLNNPTENVDEQTLEDVDARIQRLQELVMEIAVGKKFGSKKEALTSMSKLDFSAAKKGALADIQKGQGNYCN